MLAFSMILVGNFSSSNYTGALVLSLATASSFFISLRYIGGLASETTRRSMIPIMPGLAFSVVEISTWDRLPLSNGVTIKVVASF